MSERKIEEALENINDSLRTNKGSAYYQNNLAGIICYSLNKTAPSKNHFEAALSEADIFISRSSRNAGAYSAKGLAHIGFASLGIDYEQNKKEAIEAYTKARGLDNGKGVLQERLQLMVFLNFRNNHKEDYKRLFEAITGDNLIESENTQKENILLTSKNQDPIEPVIAPLKAFVSYSKFDGESNTDGINYLKEFKARLAPLSNFNKLIQTWDDTYLIAGDEWDSSIKKQLETCDIIFLLISPHFLNTKYIIEEELSVAIERYKEKECIVVPIIIKAL